MATTNPTKPTNPATLTAKAASNVLRAIKNNRLRST